ncbi:MAG TPA: site-specific integrase, partial [Nitrospira sp.]|nr:site-specific integrase [Nitrospira sp.]
DWQRVAFAIETCLRREEQFQLRWDQIDLEAGQLTIPLPKGGRTRHVPLSETAKAILRSLDSFAHSPWVFPSTKNPLRHCSAQAFVNRVFTPSLKQLGIQGACWHTLRHTAASRRVMAGVDLVAVQRILGHRDLQTTLRYAHLAPGHLQEAVNRGSLGATVTKTVTDPIDHRKSEAVNRPEVLEGMKESCWLGD